MVSNSRRVLVSRESRRCPLCDTLVPQRYPWSIVTPYHGRLIECLSCPQCQMPFSREVFLVGFDEVDVVAEAQP